MRIFGTLLLFSSVIFSSSAFSQSYTIDNLHTSLTFDIGHFGISRVFGRFNNIAGGFDLSDSGELSNIRVDIEANSVDTKVQRRDDHLRTPDFFNVALFPKISFVSESVTKNADNTYLVKGKVTLLNVTKDLEATVTHNGTYVDPNSGAVRQGAIVRFTLNRSDFGMTGFLSTISDDVNLVFSTEAIKN